MEEQFKNQQEHEDDAQELQMKQEYVDCEFLGDRLAEEVPGLEAEEPLRRSILEELVRQHHKDPMPLNDTVASFLAPSAKHRDDEDYDPAAQYIEERDFRTLLDYLKLLDVLTPNRLELLTK